jgi:beta-glucosidase
MTKNFPEDFTWGVATSSYQIEGATNVDGRGQSIWDTFCATPGKVINGDNGDLACDHFNRFAEDIAIMKDLGVQSYRFSMAWPRMFPDGLTREQRGFEFYDRLVDELLENDIQPLATLYHWDLPQALEDLGGWTNPAIVPVFSDYATAAVKHLGDRVSNWVTINEPWCVSWLGHMSGVHAPGVKNLDSAIAAAHHTALAHAEATRAMRAVKSDIRTGLALNMSNFLVDDESNSELTDLRDLMDAHINRWWLDAMTDGAYPQVLVDFYGEKLERVIKPQDLEKLRIDSEFLGVNYYSDSFIGTPRAEDKAAGDGGPFPFPQRSNGTPPLPHTDMGWPITPGGIKNLLVRINRDWPRVNDIAITENGAAYDDVPDANGVVNDDRRVEYLETHIDAVGEAIAEGAPVKSYFAWSLLDNFEWAEGYAKRFGLVFVDFKTLKRVPKNSAHLYRSIISQHEATTKAVTG